MDDYRKARSFYEQAVDIGQHSLLADHPNYLEGEGLRSILSVIIEQFNILIKKRISSIDRMVSRYYHRK